MSLDTDGFHQTIQGGNVTIRIPEQHPLIKLVRSLPWDDLSASILPDLQRTEKLHWWVGRPLRVRIHLGIYLLQQLFNLTDRQAEYFLHDNAAFRLFCGHGAMKKWHVPDHTKIEEFRSRLLPETQRHLANLISVHAVKLNYANPKAIDIDSTVQEANISYPSAANLLVKVAGLAKRLVEPLNQLKDSAKEAYQVNLKRIKGMLLHHFNLKRQKKPDLSLMALKALWQEVFSETWPIIKDSYQLIPLFSLPKYWNLRKALEQLQWNGYRLLELMYQQLFEGTPYNTKIYSLHAYEISCFDKNKLNKKKEFGRAYQLGRIEGNFAIVGECTSVRMPDAKSLPPMIIEHEWLFGKNNVDSVATDKGYYSLDNHLLLEKKGVKEIGLPRPDKPFNAPRNKTSGEVLEKLHNRRAGIEAIISHVKHGGQLGRSRMKSDRTTLSAGYASVLGFNLRQLKRYATGKIYPKLGESIAIASKNEKIIENSTEMILSTA